MTGTLDAASQFTGALGDIPVYLNMTGTVPPGKDFACVVPTRDTDTERALFMARSALPMWRDAAVAFKKIDSLLRGHWATELAAALAGGMFTRVLFAPAFPSMARITRGGFVHLTTGGGERIDTDIVATLESVGLSAICVPDPETLVDQSAQVLVCDALDDAMLERVVTRGKVLPGRTLWCGSAGLAAALAVRGARQVREFSAPLLAIIGSYHPVILEQLQAVRATKSMHEIRWSVGGKYLVGPLSEAIAEHGKVLLGFDLPTGMDPSTAAARINQAIHQVVPQLAVPATHIASGGETLLSVVAASDASHLDVLGDFLPGIPVSRIRGGLWAGVRVISKSGAFGDAETLVRMANAVRL